MSVTQSGLYGGRWGVFGLRYALYAAYGMVSFAGKPGSRLICPALAAAGAYIWRLPLDADIRRYVLDVEWRQMPEPVTVEALAASGVAVAVCVYASLPRHVEGQPPSVAVGLAGFLARLAVLVIIGGLGAHYYGYHPPPEFMVYVPEWQPTLADAVLIFALIAAAFVYNAASKLLTLILGAFPVVTRPLRPLKPLKVITSARKPARVSLAVPSIPAA